MKGRTVPALALLSLLMVALAVYASAERPSPGPLSAVHAQVADLAGGAGCAGCHGDGTRDGLAASCLRCHDELAQQMAQRRGLHATFPDPRDCGGCHVEHHGEQYRLVGERSLRIAGIASLDDFRHQGLAFALEGRHEQLACEQCHPHAHAQPLPEGAHRFLGLRQECTACHDDPHAGAMPGCADCHGQQGEFGAVAGFRHRSFEAVGRHAGLHCRECHRDDGPFALTRLLAAAPGAELPDARACGDCHASPHDDAWLAAVGGPRGRGASGSCTPCHEAAHDGFTAPPATIDRAAHAATGFALAPPHADVACADCHRGDDRAARYPGRAADDCAACHDSPHGSELITAAAALPGATPAKACVGCHPVGATGFAHPDAAMPAAVHEAVGFALEPPHADVACARCHQAAPAAYAVRFPGRAADDCRGCHDDPHAGQFAHGALAGSRCLDCHAGAHFRPAEFGIEHHRRTAFALDGAHQAVACAGCHRAAAAGAPVRFADAPTACVACHDDPHGGTFGRHSIRTDCARCHAPTSFRDVAATFDHAETGFALRGGHAAAACTACHPRTAPDAAGRTYAAAEGQVCADCHADPHLGQLRAAGSPAAAATDCARCHDDGSATFAASRFDHARDSRFPLDESHAALACAKCHRPYPVPGGGEVVRYKPLGTSCADCHGVVPTPRRRGEGR